MPIEDPDGVVKVIWPVLGYVVRRHFFYLIVVQVGRTEPFEDMQ